MKAIHLTIDTSQSAASAAVFRGGELIGSAVAITGEPASAGIAGLVAAALSRAGIGRAEISTIAVSTGPGSLTGLRVGLAFGRGLADALGIECRERSLLSAGPAGLDAAYAGAGSVAWFENGAVVSRPFDEWVHAAAGSGREWRVSRDLAERLEKAGTQGVRFAVSLPAAELLGPE